MEQAGLTMNEGGLHTAAELTLLSLGFLAGQTPSQISYPELKREAIPGTSSWYCFSLLIILTERLCWRSSFPNDALVQARL